MSSDLPQQSLPIIIKGGNKLTSNRIQFNSLSLFQVTQNFQSQSDEWLQSSSVFDLSYIESLNLVSPTGDAQFCQTSRMSHPLTYAFKDDQGDNIFVITEVADNNNSFTLSVDVQYPDSYFKIVPQSSEAAPTGNDWTESVFYSQSETEVAQIEVIDKHGIPVCQFMRSQDEEITLPVEPPA